MRLALFILLLIFLLIESSISSIPLLLLALISSIVLFKDSFIFLMAFLFGILLDILTFKTVGISSVFYTVFIFLILMYESKFEIDTTPFIFFASLIGSFLYLLLLGYGNIILESIISSLIGVLIFVIFKKLNFEAKVVENG